VGAAMSRQDHVLHALVVVVPVIVFVLALLL
jgi:hypothetical protein